MIARPTLSSQPPDWRAELGQAFRKPADLLEWLGIDPGRIESLADPDFPMLVPRAFAGRMEPGNPDDPLLRQVLPIAQENQAVEGFVSDPVGDGPAAGGTGILHKYHGRVLVVTTGACAVHCRYCFRQAFPYSSHNAGRERWTGVVKYLESRPEVTEVILSGGDPLMLDTRRLADLTDRLARLPWIRRIRLHTRVPVVLPARMDAELIGWMGDLPWPLTLVIHANHPAELDGPVHRGLESARRAGATLLNQAVVLRDINDNAGILARLMEAGHDCGVLPYYLHVLDRVAGAAHHEVSEETARELVTRLREILPGYLVPRLVREDAGALYKTPLL